MDRPIALVTGSAKRLGAEMLRHLAREGFRLCLHHNTARDEAMALAQELRSLGAECETVSGDLSSDLETRAIFAEARAKLGPIALLVNNASLFRNDDLRDFRAEDFNAHMAVNLRAPLRLIELMAAQPDLPKRALAVNMLDNKVQALNPDFFTYTLSKAALHSATEIAAQTLAGRLRVCGIAPSITLISGAQTPEDFEATARINPLGRRVFPQDIANAVIYLWNDASVNGQTLTIDGGQTLWHLPRDVAFLNPKDRPDA